MRFAHAISGLLALSPAAALADGLGTAAADPVVEIVEAVPTVGSGNVMRFTAGVGIAAESGYFGSDEVVYGPAATFRFEYLRYGGREVGNPDPNAPADTGLSFGGSVRMIGERSASDFPELAGLSDVDLSLELGAGATYTQSNYELFADVRYGVIGHQAWVGEVGADVLLRANEQLTFSFGPRVFWGSDDYADTYFGVDAGTSSAFAPYDARGGILSAGVALGAEYQVNDTWGLEGSVRWDRYLGDAADSPIVLGGSEDGISASIMATRRFNLEF